MGGCNFKSKDDSTDTKAIRKKSEGNEYTSKTTSKSTNILNTAARRNSLTYHRSQSHHLQSHFQFDLKQESTAKIMQTLHDDNDDTVSKKQNMRNAARRNSLTYHKQQTHHLQTHIQIVNEPQQNKIMMALHDSEGLDKDYASLRLLTDSIKNDPDEVKLNLDHFSSKL